MQEIQRYVDGIYKKTKGNKKEIRESKEEMKNYLLESVQELQREGKSQEEAVAIALERFGGENELRGLLAQLFMAQRKFGKVLLFIGLFVLLASVAASSVFIRIGDRHASSQAETAYEILALVEKDPLMTEATAMQVKELFQSTGHATELYIADQVGLVYKVDKNGWEEMVSGDQTMAIPLLYNVYRYGSPSGAYTLDLEVLDYRDIGFLVAFSGIICFFILSSIWLVIRRYHKTRKHSAVHHMEQMVC